jgi:hypothetical protein
LQRHANQGLREGYHYKRNELAELPLGEQVFGGVTFRVAERLILLSGRTTTHERPSEVAGIRIDARLNKLHILQATHWDAPEGAVVGHYTVHYEDQGRVTIPIVYGDDVSNWWYHEGFPEPRRARVAWRGHNDAASANNNARIRLYVSTWQNPDPDRRVASLDFASANHAPIPCSEAAAAPFCVAVTAED